MSKSKPNKDFGRGFYLSADYNQALAMAKTKVEQLEDGEPVVLKYEVDEQLIEQLNNFFGTEQANKLLKRI